MGININTKNPMVIIEGFNPWFIGRVGINSVSLALSLVAIACFNPWFIGRVGINNIYPITPIPE